ncbi:hypothetical protein NC653_033561 [Populus alba x Populus x berolinensis]|uniref:Uncharacterized protein n=1 Tax=Populus alba x Populus x berolinensis TaxID=444605 RepID=A0AAD6PZG3_9ROSI|nr:hypothetical protein NC653_033561 [Populus alba x Populus x berolinensis]
MALPISRCKYKLLTIYGIGKIIISHLLLEHFKDITMFFILVVYSQG